MSVQDKDREKDMNAYLLRLLYNVSPKDKPSKEVWLKGESVKEIEAILKAKIPTLRTVEVLQTIKNIK